LQLSLPTDQQSIREKKPSRRTFSFNQVFEAAASQQKVPNTLVPFTC